MSRSYRPSIGYRPAFGISDIFFKKCTRCGLPAVWSLGPDRRYGLCAGCTSDWFDYPMNGSAYRTKRQKEEFWEACFQTFLTYRPSFLADSPLDDRPPLPPLRPRCRYI